MTRDVARLHAATPQARWILRRLGALLISASWLVLSATSAVAASTPVYTGSSFGPQGMSAGSPIGAFASLQGIAVDQVTDDVYVYDAGFEGGAIYKFNATGEPVDFSALNTNVISNAGEPHNDEGEIAVDSSTGPGNGDIYVATGESDGNRVLIFNASGEAEGALTETTSVPWGEPCGVAVDPDGNVYVGLYNGESSYVDKFSTTSGSPVYSSSLFGLANICNIAVDPGGDVYTDKYSEGPVIKYPESQFNTTEEPAKEGVEVDQGGSTLGVDPVSGEAFVDEVGKVEQYGPSGARDGAFGETGAGALSVSYGVANDHGTDQVYADDRGAVEIFGPPATPPGVSIRPVTAISGHSATFNGEVYPNGSPTTYHFEDSSDGVTWVALGDKSAGSGTSEVPVSQVVSGLSGSSTYHVRLVAESVGCSADSTPCPRSSEATFPTPASSPQISGVGAAVISGSNATLYAMISPEKQASTYRFEYGPTTAYGSKVPVGEGLAGTAPTQVSQMLGGLSSFTAYHFRIVATNAAGSTYGADQTFTTTLTAGEGEAVTTSACPDEAVRVESSGDPATGTAYSLQLPDCRAYEQVTPPFKSFNAVVPGADVLANAETAAISSNGAQLLEDSTPLLGTGTSGADEELTGTYYALERGASGWTVSDLTPAASIFPISREELASPANVAVGIWSAATPSQSINAEDFYRREADGSFVDIGPLAPPSATGGPPHGAEAAPKRILNPNDDRVAGASADFSDVLFQLVSPNESEQRVLWPGDGTVDGELPSLYEYAGTGHTGEGSSVPALVGVDNQGAQISQCGTGLGASTSKQPATTQNGISAGGSTVFFNAQAGGCVAGATGPATNQVYARIGMPGVTQTTVNVGGLTECATTVSCNVTSPVTFQGASSDGSKVFFTTSQALLPGDKDTANNLYECELPGDSGSTPEPEPGAKVDACPNLQEVSVTGTSFGANVQSVVAISEEGSRVYFTATGVLTSEPDRSLPAGHQVAEEGKDNLYVWQAPGEGEPAGRISFVATLPSSSPSEAQATPDGRYLVFTATADLTSDDTSTAAQAFRYDAYMGQLVRVSICQSGSSCDDGTSGYPVLLATQHGIPGRRTISEDGAYIAFQSNAALTSQVRGGKQNIYEWHNGAVYLISDGTDTTTQAGLIGTDTSGADMFFTTADKLVGQDTDEDYDVYDARIDGGFPAPAPEPSCSGEACREPFMGSLASTTPLIASATIPAIGNLPAASAKHASPAARRVSIAKRTVRGSAIALSVSTASNGLISVSGAGIKELRKSVPKAGIYSVRPALTGKERKLLRRRRKLRLELTVSFRSASGTTSSVRIAVTVRA